MMREAISCGERDEALRVYLGALTRENKPRRNGHPDSSKPALPNNRRNLDWVRTQKLPFPLIKTDYILN
ncbi:hypothetical protein K1719_020592 [Acacia pycnantha]|nr:hypothetical protein K1719_020592 [Acacia pycnantha]